MSENGRSFRKTELINNTAFPQHSTHYYRQKKYRLYYYEVNNRYVLDLHNILDYTYIHYRSNKQNKQEFKQTYYHNNNKNKQNNTKCPN